MRKMAPIVVVAAVIFCAVLLAATKEYGTVKTTAKDVAVQFEIKGQKVVVTAKEKKLPAGSFDATSYDVLVNAKDGVYKFSSGKSKAAYTLNIEKDSTTELDLGPPFKVNVGCSPAVVNKQGQKIISIGFSLSGKNGEYYLHRVHVGAKPVPAPALQIEDEEGKILATGAFQYG
jgi:hypothetical protein